MHKLDSSKALETLPTSIVDQVTTREFRHPTAGETNNASSLNKKQPQPIRGTSMHQASNAAVSAFNANYQVGLHPNPGILSTAGQITTQYIPQSFTNRTTVINLGIFF